MVIRGSRVMVALGLFGALVGCASESDGDGSAATRPKAPSNSVPSNAPSTSLGAAGTGVPSAVAGSPGTGGNPTPNGMPQGNSTTSADCAGNATFKKEGCPCRAGETAACWTGPAADRNVGDCHDGLQICTASGEFATWGACMGEELSCGTDAGIPMTDSGTPPPPPPPEECPCIPGAVIQCSEDCSVGIICSLTATKTCLPDRTWSACREDFGVALDLPGVQCRNMLHGCLDVILPDGQKGGGEIYVGDCSSQFECGHAPLLPTTALDEPR